MPRKNGKPNYTQLRDIQLEWPHIFAQWVCIRILHAYFSLFYSLKVVGREHRPKEWQSYIVAASHTSALDPPFVSVALDYQPVSYMAKQELFEKPLMRIYNILMSTFAVNRQKLELSTVKTALKVLKHGKWALGIFPEGTRKKGQEEAETKRGVAYFAKAGNVPILPVGIYHEGRHAEVHFGPMIPPEKDIDALTLKIQETIQDLVAQAKAGVTQRR